MLRLHLHALLDRRTREHGLWTCLDVGCGTGDLSVEIALRHRLDHVHGIDGRDMNGAPQRLDEAPPSEGPSVTFSREDLGGFLPLEDDSFDVALAREVMERVEDRRCLVHELCRVSRKLVISEVHRRSRNEIESLFDRAGYRLLEVRPVFFLKAISTDFLLVHAPR